MTVGIMQAYFFPYIGYFQLLDAVDVFRIYEHVSFRKKSWITRNRILDKGKKSPVFINVPVQKGSANRLLGDTFIDNKEEWRKKILNLIFYNYKKAPYFKEVYKVLEELVYFNSQSIHTYNAHSIKKLSEMLNISTTIISTHKEFVGLENSLCKIAEKHCTEVKTQRILEICKKDNATTYVNAIGGTELYDKNKFLANGLTLKFVETSPYTYQQFNASFNAHLSIIDVLMHNGFIATSKMIKNYKLV